jgi:hypothetical protein
VDEFFEGGSIDVECLMEAIDRGVGRHGGIGNAVGLAL